MKYQVTKDFPPLNALSCAWMFLELSRLRVLFLAIAWLFVGLLIVKSGGYNAIEKAIFNGFEFILEATISAIAFMLSTLFIVGTAVLYFRSGADITDDELLYDPMHSYHSSNIYHTDD
jgi:hypothetical protein